MAARMLSCGAEVRTMACRIPVLANRLSPARSWQQEVLQALYESPELLNEGLISFHYPLYEVSDEELDYFLGSLIHQAAKTAGGLAKSVGKGISTVSKVIPTQVLTAGLSWTPMGLAARAGIGALQAAGEGRNVFQGAMRSLAADPVSRFYIDTAAAAARGENILKAAQKAAQAGIGDLRQSLQFAAMVAPFIPGIGTGVAAALSAANALAAGQPITEALIAAARGAVPGGAIAQFAFDTAMNLAKGKNIGDALLASARDKIPGGPAARAAFDAAVALAKGRNIQDAAFAAAGRLLPASPYAADALSFVRKVASGQNIQRAALSTAGNAVLSRMQALGAPAIPRAAVPLPRLAFRRPLPMPFRRPRLQREMYEAGSGSGQRSATAAAPPSVIGRFTFNDITAPSDEWAKLEPLARRILAGDTNVILVGHTDPVGKERYNYDLGMRRAAEARRRLDAILERLRPGSSRSVNYIPFSAGATRPVASNRTEGGRAQNRRVEVFVYGRIPTVSPKPPVPPPVPPKGPVPPPKPPVTPPWPVSKPPGPIIPWPPKDVTIQPPPSGRRHWVWDALSSAAAMLGIVLTAGVTAISAEVLAKAIAAAEAELRKYGPGTKGIGNAGEAAARVILEDKLGHGKYVYDLNNLSDRFPLLDLITPEDCASVKTYGALGKGDLPSIVSGLRRAYIQGAGQDYPTSGPGSKFRKVTQAAQLLWNNKSRIPSDALPAAIRRARSVAAVESYLLDCFKLYVPSDLVKPTCEAIVMYLAEKMGVAITIGGKSLPGKRISRAQGEFLARECRRVQSSGPSLSDFRAIVEAARSRVQGQHEFYEIDTSERGLVSSQIAANQRDAYRLTDFVFYRRHPEMRGRRIGANETQLRNEWLSILRDIVQPALRAASPSAPVRDGMVAGALAIAARPVPGMPGVTIQQLIEQWRPRIAPEIPLSVILAFLPFESGGNFDDATHGLRRNNFTSPPFYELGLFQTPAGLHGKCTTEKYQSCEYPPPGVENPRDLSPWYLLCRKVGADPAHDWQNPAKQVRVGLLSIECPARRIRKLFPELFPMPGTDWDLRMAVLMAFARGGGFAQAFLSHYRKDLASLPEDRRWDFLRGKTVPYRAGTYWTFDTNNVDSKMDLAAKLGYLPGAGERSAIGLSMTC
ncbi:MAG TPA: OmpA family protein [Bryobacteraceae bacterium]|nr:OmpA family protein [Bryobacteraceae bacterium]